MCAPWKRGGGNLKHFISNELAQKKRCSIRDYVQSAKKKAEMNHFPTRGENIFARRGNNHGEGVALGGRD